MTEIQENVQSLTRLVTSRGIQRTAVNITLLITGSICLLSLAVLATGLFHQNYLPDQVIETPLFLQYGVGSHPYAYATLAAANLKSQQAYDISISLTVPRSPANTEKGNFMITLHLLDSIPDRTSRAPTEKSNDYGKLVHDGAVTFTSKRPTIIPHEDPVIGLASRLVFLPYHIFVPDSQLVHLDVVMAENSVLATHTANLPTWAFVELGAGQSLETCRASLVLTAQLRGLRWVMHNYRALSFLLATLLFWSAEILFMMVAWLLWAYTSGFSVGVGTQISVLPDLTEADDVVLKKEEDDLSEVSRAVPTYVGQHPRVYRPGTSLAERAHDPTGPRLHDAEADDEADDDVTVTGASLERAGTGIRRRLF